MAIRKRRQKKLPTWVPRQKGEEVIVELRPPGLNLGEPMPITIMKGKVPATEQPELIVWDNRQRIP